MINWSRNGAGLVLNEVDGNFTMLRDETGLHRFYWLGKIRARRFEPLYFKIDHFDSPDVVTTEGVRVLMPFMSPIGEGEVETRGEALAQRDLMLLRAMADDPAGSERKWATVVGVSRRAVQMMLERLQRDRLVAKKARRWKSRRRRATNG